MCSVLSLWQFNAAVRSPCGITPQLPDVRQATACPFALFSVPAMNVSLLKSQWPLPPLARTAVATSIGPVVLLPPKAWQITRSSVRDPSPGDNSA